MKKVDHDKVIMLLMRLPPGTPLSIAYKNAAKMDAIPKDPLSPSSYARGDNGIFPILDLSGALPGFHNQFILLMKAECLFAIGDFIGCVRVLSIALEDFNYNDVKKGQRQVNNLFQLMRTNKNIRMGGMNSQEV